MHGVALGMTIDRIGDYRLTRALPAMMAGVLEFEATHVLLPRRAHVRIAARGSAHALMRHACTLEALRHPGVPRVYECGVLTDERPWIAFEELGGPTLAELMLERALGPMEMLVMLRDLAEILHHAHMRGIAHEHLRPEAIERTEDGGFLITGWGATTDGTNARADIHALGAMMSLTMSSAAPIPRAITVLLERMTSGIALAQPSAAEVRAEAIRLLDGTDDEVEPEVELIEVELLAGGT